MATSFSPIQFIHNGKSERSLVRVKFPGSFMLSTNEKHFSNTHKSLKLLDEIVIPYVEKECPNLQLPNDSPAFLIMDVFSGQMAKPVIKKIQENNIKLVRVPPNMTNLFHPLDRIVNGAAKAFLKSKFTEWYNNCISVQLDEGKAIENVKVKLWTMDLFNYLTSEKGRGIISNSWKAAFTTEAICSELNGLEPWDPFQGSTPWLPRIQTHR